MIFSQFSSRRRVFVKRVASVSSITLAVSLAACGSHGLSFGGSDSTGSYSRQTANSAPVPPEPIPGYSGKRANTYGATLQPASYDGGSAGSSIERTSLAPVRTASSDGGSAGTYMGGSYAMQPLDADAVGQPARGVAGERYAQASSGHYDRRASDYQPSYSDYKPYRKPYRRPEPSYDTPKYDSARDYVAPKYDSAPDYDAPKYERSGDDYGGGSYLVVEGDTLYGIAKRYGMTTGELAGLNGITGSTIYAGQRLHVRGAPKYTAASRYDRKLPRYEAEAPSRYDNGYAEDERKAPPHYSEPDRDDDYEDAESDSYDAPKRHAKRYEAPPREYGPKASRYRKPKGSYDSYQVRRGDTLFEIARSYGLSHHELARYNDIPPSATLYPGQRLHIPKGYSFKQGPDHDDEPGDSYSRRDRRDYEAPAEEGYSRRRVPYSQNSGDGGDKRKPARRVARAEPAEGADARVINDASPRRADPASAPSREPQSQPILAAHSDADPQRPAGTSAASGSNNCESLLANPIPRSAQTFRQPVQGLMVAKFGSNEDGSFNDGVDFAVPKGTPVKAAENGVVAYVGNELSGFGNLVLVRHADGYVTAYAHNDEILVSRCDVVQRGQTIAKAGATGKVTQPQLHFELRKDSKAIDPLSHFSRS